VDNYTTKKLKLTSNEATSCIHMFLCNLCSDHMRPTCVDHGAKIVALYVEVIYYVSMRYFQIKIN
jgi:hypothetical protein